MNSNLLLEELPHEALKPTTHSSFNSCQFTQQFLGTKFYYTLQTMKHNYAIICVMVENFIVVLFSNSKKNNKL
jgi:hypothetical protein